MIKDNDYDVIVLGNTIAAFSTALQLSNHSQVKTLWIKPSSDFSLSWSFPDISVGFDMAHSRFIHARGSVTASNLQRFTEKAQLYADSFLKNRGIPTFDAIFTRVACDLHESDELEISYRESENKALFTLGLENGLHYLQCSTKQYDDNHLSRLSHGLECVQIEPESLIKTAGGFELIMNDNIVYSCSIPILMCDRLSKKLDPVLNSSLIPVSDQLVKFQYKSDVLNYTSKKHSYLWSLQTKNTTTLGGGRFLRKMAGFEEEIAQYDLNIENYLLEQNPQHKSSTKILSRAYTEYLPCDELPIIGPVNGNFDGALVFAGKMTKSNALDFFASKVVTDFVMKGKSDDLPKELLPSRLFY